MLLYITLLDYTERKIKQNIQLVCILNEHNIKLNNIILCYLVCVLRR